MCLLPHSPTKGDTRTGDCPVSTTTRLRGRRKGDGKRERGESGEEPGRVAEEKPAPCKQPTQWGLFWKLMRTKFALT